MKIKSIAPIAIAAAAAVLVTGCGTTGDLGAAEKPTPSATAVASESTAAPEMSATPAAEKEEAGQSDLEVVDQEFWRGADGDWQYFVTVHNPNNDYVWTFAGFDVEFLDAENTILDTSSDYVNLLPNETVAMAGTLYDSGDLQIESLNIRGPEDGTYMPDEEWGAFTLSEPEVKNDDYSATVSGTVESTFVEDQESVKVVAVVFDKDGKPIDSDSTYVDRIPTGGKARYELSFWDLTISPEDSVKVWAQV